MRVILPSSSSLSSRCVPWLGECLSTPSLILVSLSCSVLCQIVSLQYLSRSYFHRWADLLFRLFVWSQRGDTRGPSVVFEAVNTGEIPGKIRRGRPNLRWKDACKRDMTEIGLKEDNTTNRAAWRNTIIRYTGEPR